MQYYAKVIELDEDIEEGVLLSFGKITLYCFIASCPYEIIKGSIYPVDIELSFLENENIKPCTNNQFLILRKNDGFEYEITGFKIGGQIIIDSIVFSDQLFIDEYAYLNYEYVSITPDRISVSFI